MTEKVMETLDMKKVSIVLHSNSSSNNLEPQAFILQQSDLLFSQYGIKSITMDDIAKHLGMSKKTIYLHFKDKNELILQLMRQKMENQSCIIDQCCENAHNAIHEQFSAITNLVEMLAKTNPTMFLDLQKFYPDAWGYFRDFRENHLMQKVVNNLNWGIKDGLYRSEINIDILSRMRLEQIELSFNQMIFPGHLFSMSQVAKEITIHFVYGIATEKGYALIKQYEKEH